MVRQLFTHFFAALLTALALSAAVVAAPAVDVNQASQAELESVKGIGPALSGRIMAARSQSKFKDWPDLLQRVSGLGDKSAQRVSGAGLTVGGTAYASMDSAAPVMQRVKADKPAKAESGKTPRPVRASAATAQ